jgi:hypothetical protein
MEGREGGKKASWSQASKQEAHLPSGGRVPAELAVGSSYVWGSGKSRRQAGGKGTVACSAGFTLQSWSRGLGPVLSQGATQATPGSGMHILKGKKRWDLLWGWGCPVGWV